jgi:predicted enzyme related to lactoylglutathione lyase
MGVGLAAVGAVARSKNRRKVVKDVTDVMGMGWLSILTDPTGAMFGLPQAKK